MTADASVRSVRGDQKTMTMAPCTQPTALCGPKNKRANFDRIFTSNSKTALFERKRWAPPLLQALPKGRPLMVVSTKLDDELGPRNITWLGPPKTCPLGPLWMKLKKKNSPPKTEAPMPRGVSYLHCSGNATHFDPSVFKMHVRFLSEGGVAFNST